MPNNLNIVIRIMPNGDELDVELPVYSTGKEVVEELLAANVAPRVDGNGNPYIYELISKVNSVKVEEHKTLYDIGVRDGEIILLIPKLVAG